MFTLSCSSPAAIDDQSLGCTRHVEQYYQGGVQMLVVSGVHYYCGFPSCPLHGELKINR